MTGVVQRAVLITAEEAYPEFERLFLNARAHVRMGFRIFDPRTKLRSEEGRAIGEDWFDLLLHTLRRGVRVELALSDFDPVVGTDVHQMTWRSIRLLTALAELAGPDPGLRVVAALHPARVSSVPRAALYGQIRSELKERAAWLNALGAAERARALTEVPGLVPHLHVEADGVRPRAWPVPPLVPATHHQKLAVFDEETLYIGGLDLDERRWDTWEHEEDGPETWHDVQVIVTGEAARDAHAHLGRFLDEVAGRVPVEEDGGHLLRTLSVKRSGPHVSMSPIEAVSEIGDLHYREAARAERFVYLESQFLRDRKLAHLLADRARENPELRCILILPAAPEDVAFAGSTGLDARYGEFLQARCLRRLRKAFRERLFIGTPATRRREAVSETEEGRDLYFTSPLIYVHAKVSIFDDRIATVSSANLNGRSFRWDTEAGVAFETPEEVRHLRARCFDHWLPEEAGPEFRDPQTAVAAWREMAVTNASTPPGRRRGFILPYLIKPGEGFGRNLPGVPEEMV